MVKRIVILFLIWGCSVIAGVCQNNDFTVVESNPIQNTFFGCIFGEDIYSAERILEKSGYSVFRDGCWLKMVSKLKDSTVIFGGIDFNSIDFYFVNNKFAQCFMERRFLNDSDALLFLNRLKTSLSNKYYIQRNEKDIYYVTDNYDREILLTKEYAESKGGKYFYYVTLRYTSWKLSDQSSDEL